MGSTPLIVLSSRMPGPVLDEKLEDHDLTLMLNQKLAAQSRRGTWRVVEAHQNRMRFEAQGSIVSAIEDVWRLCRRDAD